MLTVSTGNSPVSIFALNMTASVPSRGHFATSETSARVGYRWMNHRLQHWWYWRANPLCSEFDVSLLLQQNCHTLSGGDNWLSAMFVFLIRHLLKDWYCSKSISTPKSHEQPVRWNENEVPTRLNLLSFGENSNNNIPYAVSIRMIFQFHPGLEAFRFRDNMWSPVFSTSLSSSTVFTGFL